MDESDVLLVKKVIVIFVNGIFVGKQFFAKHIIWKQIIFASNINHINQIIMAEKHQTPNEKREPISAHKKSIGKSAEKSKDGKRTVHKKVEKTGGENDDWNDPTGNSHLSSGK